MVRAAMRKLLAGALCTAGAAASLRGTSVQAQQILEVEGSTLTAYLAGVTTTQDVAPHFTQRGVGIDGMSRGGSMWGWSLAGNSLGGVGTPVARLGSVNLATLAYSAQEVDLALPSAGSGRWVIGRSYNVRQRASGSPIDSDGPQGFNWFQSSQPELSFYNGATDADDMVYLVFGADRYIEFKRTTLTSNVFKGKNGAAGVIEYKSGSPDTWEYTDQAGVVTTFFGSNTSSNRANWQVWKITDPAGNVAYVGDSSSASTATTAGYNADGTISTAYDAAGRRYTYSYTTVGVSRLTQVLAEIKSGGTWASPTGLATVGTVDYTYYTTNQTGKGLIGDLQTVTVTTPLSSGVDLVRTKYYRYYEQSWSNTTDRRGTPHALKLVVGFEGVRNYDWSVDGTLDGDYLTATDADLKPYSEAWFEYEDHAADNRRRITKAFFNGECGCSGGSGTGTYEFTPQEAGTYATQIANTSYSNAYMTRSVVKRPDNTYATYTFDEVGQPLDTIITNTDPSGSPSQRWTTNTSRNASGAGSFTSTPANNASYTHSTGGLSTAPAAGYVSGQVLDTSGNLTNFSLSSNWSVGTSGTAYLKSSRMLSSVSKTIGSGTTMDIIRPVVTESWMYTQDTTTVGNGTGPAGAYKTTYAYTYWGTGAELTPKTVTTTMPSVSTSNNGPGASAVTTQYLRKDRTSAFSLGADGNYNYSQFTNGQLTKQIRDAKTNGSFVSGDDPNTDFGISETGDGDNLVSTYAYDAQGRMIESVAPDWQGATGSPTQITYYTRLADQRSVVLSVPRRTVSGGTTTYSGPVSYTVLNHAGRAEFSATLVLPGGSTTTAISAWVNTTASDPITAISGFSGATLFRITTSIYSADGGRVNSSRTYFANPSSLPGTLGTHYDERTMGYDEMGRVLQSVEPSGTITRSVYDTRGRTTERWVGTDDSGLAGSPMSGTSNMVKTESMVYDGGSSGGNSLLTQVTRYPDGATGTRVTSYQYDTRDRQVLTINPQSPHSVVKYDSAGRVIASGTYSSSSGLSATTDPTSVTTNRLSLSETAYDEAGRVYRTTSHKITFSTGASAATLVSDTWHDVVGRTIKSRGSSISKTFYDRQSRPYRQFTIAKLQDNAGTGTESDTDIAQAGTVTGDLVLEERQTIYDTASGLTLFTVALQRAHDDTTTTGARDGNGDADLTTLTVASGGSNVDYTKTRVSISATWYDDLRRPIASAAYGSNSTSSGAAGNGATFTRPGSAPSRSDTVLVSSMSYSANGTVLETTDPRGLVSRSVLDDAGRTVKTIRNYTDGTPGGGTNNDQDQTIEYGFSKGLMTTYTAKMPGGTDQVTTYIYGTTGGGSAGLSNIATGHLLRATKFPDSSNMGTTPANIDSTDTDVVSVAYNALGEEIRRKDQAGNVTETTYDTGGRPTVRAVTTLASGFDGAVRRVEMTYTSKGQADKVTQYDASSSGSVTDEVQCLYDDWGNATNFRQDKDGTVAGGGYREVAYTYSSSPYQATGGAQAVRLETITLPGGKDIDLSYGTANGIDDCVSRVASVKDVLVRSPLSTLTLANYDYLGSGMLVGKELPQPAAESMLYGAGTANYDCLDLFNRVIDSRWTRTNGSQIYHVKLGYDRDSNIVTAEDEILPGYDAKYDMDGLNRLIVADEGTLSSGSIGSRTRKETWSLNQVGGWTTFTSDLNGDGTLSSPAFGPTDEKNETRTFSVVNETSTRVNNGVTKSPVYNANGQQTDDGVNYTYEWDAFGRLRKVKNRSTSALVVEYTYNGLNHQIGRHADLDADGDVDNTDKWEWTIYDPRWRRVATYMVAGGSNFGGAVDSDPKERYIHHAAGRSGGGSYIDSVILRDRDQSNGNNGVADGTLEQRLYFGQNWRADVVMLMSDSGRILERIKYSAYGVAQRIPVADFNRDGSVDFFDLADYDDCYTGAGCPSGQTADMNLDGFVDLFDYDEWDLNFAEQGSTARGVLSQNDASAAVNRVGYAGYFFEPSTQQYLVRNRELDPLVGVWDERDPLGYHDGADLYMYAQDSPIDGLDPMGLRREPSDCLTKDCQTAVPEQSDSATGSTHDSSTQSSVNVDAFCSPWVDAFCSPWRCVFADCIATAIYPRSSTEGRTGPCRLWVRCSWLECRTCEIPFVGSFTECKTGERNFGIEGRMDERALPSDNCGLFPAMRCCATSSSATPCDFGRHMCACVGITPQRGLPGRGTPAGPPRFIWPPTVRPPGGH